MKFTHASLAKFFEERPTGICWDETRGLGSYKTGRGDIMLFVQYRLGNGKQRKKTLGKLQELPLPEFRALALKYTMAARHGEDLVEAQRIKDAPRLTLSEAYEAYCMSLKRKGASPATLSLNAQNYGKRLERLAGRELASLTRTEVRAFHASWGKAGHFTVANQTLRLLRTIINFSRKRLDAADLHENVCEAVELFQERGERKVISAAELAAWWRQTGLIANPLRCCYWRGLLLTGLRRQELASLRWEHVLADRIKIICPKGGVKRAFELFITDELRLMFPHSPWVFAAASSTGYMLNPFDVNLPGSAPHAVRRTFASLATECGIDPYTLRFLLNHSTGAGNDVTSRYVIPSWEHRAAASRKVAAHVIEVVGAPKLLDYQPSLVTNI
jgi:integrase